MRRIVAAVVSGMVALTLAGCSSQPVATGKNVFSSGSSETAAPAKGTTRNGGATLAKYNKVKNGMTYAHVVSILGSEGVLNTSEGNALGGEDQPLRVKAPGAGVKQYTWLGPDSASRVTVNFSKGKVVSKSESGLQ